MQASQTDFLVENMNEYPLTSSILIDLNHLVDNYKFLTQKAPNSIIAAAVKANAYGLGAVEVVDALTQQGAEHFFVATADEGIELRQAFKKANIYVIYGPQEATIGLFKKHNLIPVLNSIPQITLWCDAVARSRKEYYAIVHFDTGINRLGLTKGEFTHFSDHKLWQNFNCIGFMSHLACADLPEHPLNKIQLDRFLDAKAKLPNIMASFANSSGIFLGQEYHFSMVRPGIALYGGNPTPQKTNPMKNVVSIYGKLVQIKKVLKGETIGYGASYQVPETTHIGILLYGYADGYMRSAQKRGFVFYKGQKLPVLGRMSMDLMAFDLGPVMDLQPQLDDFVELLGTNLPLHNVAESMGTIDYELLTSLRERAGRFYIK